MLRYTVKVKPHSFLKHVFIPHEHNDYKPHFFREVSVAIIVIGSIFLLGFSAGSSFLIKKTVLGASVTASVLVDLTNESRLAYNEAPLVRNPVLDRAATLKAEDMAKEGYFAHDSPEGLTPWHWFKQAGYTFLYAGENLAINFVDADEVRNAWLASPLHRANLLDVKFKEIGMATVSGVYKNGPTIYVVQMFGTPAVAKETIAAETPPTVEKETSEPQAQSETQPTETLTPQTSPILAVGAPEIKGESVETKPEYESVITTEELAVVRNNEVQEVAVSSSTPSTPEKYSTWYGRLLFGGSYYVDILLKGLLALTIVALLTMIFIEIRKQHWKHITYGLALLLVITLCLLINQAF